MQNAQKAVFIAVSMVWSLQYDKKLLEIFFTRCVTSPTQSHRIYLL